MTHALYRLSPGSGLFYLDLTAYETPLIIGALAVIAVIMILAVFLIADAFANRRTGTGETSAAPADRSAEEDPESSVEDEEGDHKDRFCMLTEIESRKDSFSKDSYDDQITLEEFCTRFRDYSAYSLGLYYSIDDIRRFIAGMAVSHIIILQGMSGTGKTSLAVAFGRFTDRQSSVIPVQPMWKERTDLIGYYNEFTKRFHEEPLLQLMYEANYSKDIYVTVLDEMNIARVEYYFAEFLSMLELPDPETRYLGVVTDKWETDPPQLKDGKIKVPENMWFIGTANNDDSTFAISDKVYDRAMIMNLDRKCERFSAPPTAAVHLSAERFKALTDAALKDYRISSRNLQRLKMLDTYMTDHFHVTFGNRIMKQITTYIPVYIACGGDELDALDDILAKKVFRKLETQNPIYLRTAAQGLADYLDSLFGEDRMASCLEFIRKLQRNA